LKKEELTVPGGIKADVHEVKRKAAWRVYEWGRSSGGRKVAQGRGEVLSAFINQTRQLDYGGGMSTNNREIPKDQV